MKKLKKNLRPENQTIEAMRNSCTGGCSCGNVSCGCNSDPSANYSMWRGNYDNLTSAFRNGAW